MNIIFMGTPEFAVHPLKTLIENKYSVSAVITAPDKPAGRGKKLRASAVKEFAIEHGIKVLQPTNLKSEAFVDELKSLQPDLQIVVAFRMLPEVVWKLPPLGTFNLHASLLPDYRGAAPINHAVINGDSETGLTTFFIDEKIDTGRIIKQKKLSIEPDETAGELHDRMMVSGSDLVLETVRMIENNSVQPVPQEELLNDKVLRPAPKIFKEDCRINWSKRVERVHNLIRGLSPYPGAFSFMSDESGREVQVKIFQTKAIREKHSFAPGEIITDNESYIKVAVDDGFIKILQLQMAGKKSMKTEDFLRGFRFEGKYYFK